MSEHRAMKVRIETPAGVHKVVGDNCHVTEKTWRTRLGLEFDETIWCDRFGSEPAEPGVVHTECYMQATPPPTTDGRVALTAMGAALVTALFLFLGVAILEYVGVMPMLGIGEFAPWLGDYLTHQAIGVLVIVWALLSLLAVPWALWHNRHRQPTRVRVPCPPAPRA